MQKAQEYLVDVREADGVESNVFVNGFAKEGAMHTEVHNAVMAADQGTQYDESAKRLLGTEKHTGTDIGKNGR